jgi:hypothetical protein
LRPIADATPVRDELLVEPRPEQAVVDRVSRRRSAYGPRRSARDVGLGSSSTGSRHPRQGAASFQLDRRQAPVDVMRTALA